MSPKPQQKNKGKNSPKVIAAKPSNKSTLKTVWLYAIGVLLVTFVVLYPVLSADFLNWDDPTFVLGNKHITALSAKTIKEMFTTYAMGNYCPLAILSYAIDFQLAGGLHPAIFHVTSLIFHLAGTLVLFFLVFRISNGSYLTAAVAAILFGIHPMHLESVAWVSERRDVLYAFFYLLGLLAYTAPNLHHKERETEREGVSFRSSLSALRSQIWALLFFFLSLLSKGQAVTFPIALLAIDFIRGRKIDIKCLIEKIPFFLLALIFGVLAFVAQRTTPTFNPMHIALWHTPFVAAYGLMLYLVKAIIPYKLSGFHPYPFSATVEAPPIVFASVLIIAAFAWLVYKKWRTNRIITGGLLFFLLTILPVLQFVPVGETIISERYTYVPYIGLFFVIGSLAGGKLVKNSGMKTYLAGGTLVWIAILCVISHSRTSVWKEPVAFWSDVIDKYPESKVAYNNRGYIYNEFGEYDKAIQDFNKGIAVAPDYGRLYLNRGLSYYRMKQFDQAFADYSLAIKYDTTEVQSYINRGTMYTDIYNKYDLGLADFRHAFRLTPDNENISANMGVAYYKKKVYDSSLMFYNKSIEIAPTAKSYLMRALTYAAMRDYPHARQDAEQARQMGMAMDTATLNSWK